LIGLLRRRNYSLFGSTLKLAAQSALAGKFGQRPKRWPRRWTRRSNCQAWEVMGGLTRLSTSRARAHHTSISTT